MQHAAEKTLRGSRWFNTFSLFLKKKEIQSANKNYQMTNSHKLDFSIVKSTTWK